MDSSRNETHEDASESAVKECGNTVTESKKKFEGKSTNTRMRSNAEHLAERRADADCSAIAAEPVEDSNKAKVKKSKRHRKPQPHDSTDRKKKDSYQVAVTSGMPINPALQQQYQKLIEKVSDAIVIEPLLKEILETDTFLARFQQSTVEIQSSKGEELLEEASRRFQLLLEMVSDLLESWRKLEALRNNSEIKTCFSIVFNKSWISSEIKEIYNPLYHKSFVLTEEDFQKKIQLQRQRAQEKTHFFKEIAQENSTLDNVNFDYKISEPPAIDSAELVYFELTDSSNNSRKIALSHPIAKENIKVLSIGADYMEIEWTTSQEDLSETIVVDYEIQQQRDVDEITKSIEHERATRSCTITDLEEDTNYRFRVVPLCEFGVRMPQSEFSDTFKTKKRENLQKRDSTAQNNEKIPSKMDPEPQLTGEKIINLPKKLVNETIGTKRFTIGEHVDKNILEKVILVVGGTGCGKTTLINTLANYLYEVKFDVAKRYAIITDKDELEESGTCAPGRSKTRFVTAYEFGVHKDLPYRLTLVDTPGFGDTQGVDRDKKTVGYIKEWFTQEQKQISAICIVIKYNETRIKPQVQYELHSVISLFGKNVENNVFMLFTFCDGSTPQTINTLQELKLPVKETFKVNSRAVLDLPSERIMDNEDDMTIAKFYWKMTMDSFEHFLTVLKSVNDETLVVSLGVLQQREILDTLVQQIPFYVKRIQFLVHFANQITEQREAIDTNNDQISFVLKEFKAVPVEDDKIEANNCLKCQVTCHKECGKQDPLAQKNSCLIFTNDESRVKGSSIKNCQICDCSSSDHSLQKSIFEMVELRNNIDIHEALSKFHEQSSSKKSTSIIQGIIDQLVINDMKLRDIMRRIGNFEKELVNASLGESYQKTAVGRLDDEIISEKQHQKPGYEERMKILERHKDIIERRLLKQDFKTHWQQQFSSNRNAAASGIVPATSEENHPRYSPEKTSNIPKHKEKQKCTVQ